MDFLTGARSRVGGPSRCSTFRWCLKKDTSLVVVSIRNTMPHLSYILIEDLPKRCFTQVPSMRVENCDPISWASRGVMCRPRKLATCSAFTLNTDWRMSCSWSDPRVAVERNARSVAYSTCIRLQWYDCPNTPDTGQHRSAYRSRVRCKWPGDRR